MGLKDFANDFVKTEEENKALEKAKQPASVEDVLEKKFQEQAKKEAESAGLSDMVARGSALQNASSLANSAQSSGAPIAQQAMGVAGQAGDTYGSTLSQQEARRHGLEAQAQAQANQLASNQQKRENQLFNQIIGGAGGAFGALASQGRR